MFKYVKRSRVRWTEAPGVWGRGRDDIRPGEMMSEKQEQERLARCHHHLDTLSPISPISVSLSLSSLSSLSLLHEDHRECGGTVTAPG